MHRFTAVLATAVVAALAAAAGASAHAKLSPPVALAQAGQVFTLAVPTEKEGATTTRIELDPPAGFTIDSVTPTPGWHVSVQQRGQGEDAVVQKVVWTGGSVPTGQAALLQFVGRTEASETYAFRVRQTYSDGSVVDWSGAEGSDAPAPTVKAVSSFGGGTSTLSIVALVVGALGLVVGIVALVSRGGGRRLA